MVQQKISLSLSDVKHLQRQFSNEANDKLDLYLPTTEVDDPLKERVSTLVKDFIYEVFETAKDGMEIDGADESVSLRSLLDNPPNEVEPFDFSLQEQVRKLYQDVENETTHLTKLRRETPQQLKRTYEESFNKSLQELSSLQKEIEQLEEEDDDMEDKFKKLKPKLDEMTVQYSQSIHQIKEIRDDIPGERGELDKLEQITKFLVEKK